MRDGTVTPEGLGVEAGDLAGQRACLTGWRRGVTVTAQGSVRRGQNKDAQVSSHRQTLAELPCFILKSK